jgi:uncharacterized protein
MKHAILCATCERQPDAAYLLVQRALLLGQALDAAKARIAALERGQARSNQGFLNSGTSGWSAANQAPSAAGAAPVPPTQGPSSAAPPSGSAPPPKWASPFRTGRIDSAGQRALTSCRGGRPLAHAVIEGFGLCVGRHTQEAR